MTFRIMDSDLPVVNVVRFLQNHPARIEGKKFSFDLFQVVYLQTDMMEARFHAHFAERRPFFEKR
jgi:hypothetical protein